MFLSLILILFPINSIFAQVGSDLNWDTTFISNNYPNNYITIIKTDGKDLYIGGRFTSFQNDNQLKYFIRSDGTNFFNLGFYLNPINAMVFVQNNIYMAGGYHLYKYNGNNFEVLSPGSGFDASVLAVEWSNRDSSVYIGGVFSKLGFLNYTLVARWNNGNFYPVGNGLVGAGFPRVYIMAQRDDDIYLGGSFSSTGDYQGCNYITKWNGTVWSIFDKGVSRMKSPEVYAIKFKGSDMYVGGSFDKAGDKSANNIARWDGKEWSPLGSGTNGIVRTIEVKGNDLFVGGDFTVAGGKSAKHIARWDGQNWYPLGSGIDVSLDAEGLPTMNFIQVNSICAFGDYLYVGGNFNLAGGKQSNYLARYKISTVGVEKLDKPKDFILNQNYPNPFNPRTVISFRLPVTSYVKLIVYDVLGREISTLVNERKTEGNYSVEFDGSKLSSGTYYYRLEVTPSNGDKKITIQKAMVLMK